VLYAFCRDVVGLKYQDQANSDLNLWSEVAQSCGWWWPFRGLCFVAERPTAVRWESDRAQPRVHSLDAPGVEFRDGWKLYAVRGVLVPERIVTDPGSIKWEDIDAESNAEVRRVMVERYGIERYLVDSKAEVLHEDMDLLGHPRKLVRKKQPGDEDLVAVLVKNSTVEPDGSRKDYLLLVHPELRPLYETCRDCGRPTEECDHPGRFGELQQMTCQNAVASTFGLRGEEYSPAVET
jgi:hypothetical protein